jgi:hypothetical protein
MQRRAAALLALMLSSIPMARACEAILESGGTRPLPGFDAAGDLDVHARLAALGVRPEDIELVRCAREPLELRDADVRIPAAGLALEIGAADAPTRLHVEQHNGEFTLYVIGAMPPPEQVRAIMLKLNRFHLPGDVPAPPPPPKPKAAPAPAPEPQAPDVFQDELEARMCAAVGCYENVRVQLRQADGSAFDRTYPRLPRSMQPGVPIVVAGQDLLLEAKEEDGRLLLVPVREVRDAARTVSAKLEQLEDGGMMLELRSPFDRRLKLDVALMRLDGDRLERTTTCPIVPHGFSTEVWPYPIYQVVVLKARLLGEDEQVGCVE